MSKLSIFAAAMCLAVSAHANLVTNGSFEVPVDGEGWSTENADGHYLIGSFSGWTNGYGISGLWRPNLGVNTFGSLPDGLQAGFGGGDGGPAMMYQDLGTINAGEAYNLSAWIGNRADLPIYSLGGAGWVRLVSSDNTILADSGNITATSGSFQNVALSFSANASGKVGQTFRVELGNTAGNQASFDNVQVNAVPEPFTMSLGLASAGLFLRRRLKAKKA